MDFTAGDDILNTVKKWFAATRQPTIQDVLAYGASSSGQIVNPRSILTHPAVWRGVDLISTSIARIAFEVYERKPDGSRCVAENHDAQYLIRHYPNRYYSRFQLFKTWAVNTLTHGDGYIYVRRDGFGRPLELILLESAATTFVQEGDRLWYSATDRFGKAYSLDASEVLHLRGLGTDGFTGLPVSQVLADAFGLGLTLQRYQNVFFENGGRPSVAIKLPPEINTREKVDEFRDAWGEVHGGPRNAFKPALLMPGASIEPITSDKAVEELAKLREHDLVTIANCLGLPPHRIGAKSTSVSYGSLEQENLSFLQDIDGWITQAEQELGMKLLRTSERLSHYIEGDRENLVQMDSEAKAKLYAAYRRNSLYSDEEIRRKLNAPPPKKGDTFWVEANLVERSKALAAEPPTTEAPEQTTTDEPDGDENETPDTDTQQLSLRLTASIVGRLQRRAAKSGKFDLQLWRDEFGDLPGYEDIRIEAGDSTSLDHFTSLEPSVLATALWQSKKQTN